MTKLITADAGDDDPKDSVHREPNADQRHEERSRSKRGKIPDTDDCLAALANLAGAVAMGLLKPAQAGAIRANFTEILRHHQKNESRSDRKGITDADVVELMRKDPKIFSMLEPFLTDEQIDLVMKNAKDGDRGQA